MTAYRPVLSEHPGAWHMERFAEFDALKAAIGEPTPHMRIVQLMSRDVDRYEKLWRAGCYAVGYSILTAEAIWREWPLDRFLRERAAFPDWLAQNWPGIHTRTPRRAVRTQANFLRCLNSYRSWMFQEPLLVSGYDASYDTWWKSANRIEFMGRYIVIRLLELLRRWGFMKAELPDIRAMDAESPVRCLSLLRPDAAEPLLAGDVRVADRVAHEVLAEASTDGSYFRFAALLCEYRKSYEDRGDYPGNQTDEELGYTHSRYADHWRTRGFDTGLFDVRAEVVPDRVRGEVHGWTGQRKLAASALRDHGVNWSDLRFDWAATEAAGRPVPWAS